MSILSNIGCHNWTQFAGLVSFAIAGILCAVASARNAPARLCWDLISVTSASLSLEVAVGLRHHLHDLLNQLMEFYGFYDMPGIYRRALPLGLALLIALAISLYLARRWKAAHRQRAVEGQDVALYTILGAVALFALEAIPLPGVGVILYASIGNMLAIGWLWAFAASIVAIAAVRTHHH